MQEAVICRTSSSMYSTHTQSMENIEVTSSEIETSLDVESSNGNNLKFTISEKLGKNFDNTGNSVSVSRNDANYHRNLLNGLEEMPELASKRRRTSFYETVNVADTLSQNSFDEYETELKGLKIQKFELLTEAIVKDDNHYEVNNNHSDVDKTPNAVGQDNAFNSSTNDTCEPSTNSTEATSPSTSSVGSTKKRKLDDKISLEKVLRQVEYYFSDENLRHDVFFQGKMEEARGKGMPKGWLEMKYIMNSPRIKAFSDTFSEEEIVQYLAKNSKILKFNTDESNITWISRFSDIPPLQSLKKKSSNNARLVVKMTKIPEEVSGWNALRTILTEQLSDEKKKYLRFVSEINHNRTCYMYFKPFEDDELFFQNCTFNIFGVDLKVLKLEDGEELNSFLNRLPRGFKKELNVSRNEPKRTNSLRNFIIGGTVFKNIDTLRSYVSHLLNDSIIGEEFTLDSTNFKILLDLLEYHPIKEDKLKKNEGYELVAFKVGELNNLDESKSNGQKSFFTILKRNEEMIEMKFSVFICIVGMKKRKQETILEGNESANGKIETSETSNNCEISGETFSNLQNTEVDNSQMTLCTTDTRLVTENVENEAYEKILSTGNLETELTEFETETLEC